jgi:hypothetical protein
MKSFLLKDKKPIVKWSMVPDETYFEGTVPEGYGLAICPHDPYIILDIDKHGNINGFDNVPEDLLNQELFNSLYYKTKNDGCHVWLKYSGTKTLLNKTSGLGIDLRTSKGYVKWYLPGDIRDCIHLINETSPELNTWLESLFQGVKVDNYDRRTS